MFIYLLSDSKGISLQKKTLHHVLITDMNVLMRITRIYEYQLS